GYVVLELDHVHEVHPARLGCAAAGDLEGAAIERHLHPPEGAPDALHAEEIGGLGGAEEDGPAKGAEGRSVERDLVSRAVIGHVDDRVGRDGDDLLAGGTVEDVDVAHRVADVDERVVQGGELRVRPGGRVRVVQPDAQGDDRPGRAAGDQG